MPKATTQETLSLLTSQVEALVQIHNVEAEAKANQSQMWPKAKSWIGKNIIWVAGIVAGIFIGWLELRDGYRDHLRVSSEFQERTSKEHAEDSKALVEHKADAKEDVEELRDAIIETQVTAVEVLDQLQKEMRVVHPKLKKNAPKESETLGKARDAAAKAKAEEDVFKEKG